MHELALTHSIVELVLDRAQLEGMRTVTRVVLEVGAAAGVDSEALQFCFDAVTHDTPAQGARLAIEAIPLRAVCRDCGDEFQPDGLIADCPHCHAYAPTFIAGQELRVKEFDGF
ncbi:MAG: hydrogenase maturation nickel metallochaperone HypA [SAR324 cluster bacterium]